jgi:RND family efflux transporter MFP subunit
MKYRWILAVAVAAGAVWLALRLRGPSEAAGGSEQPARPVVPVILSRRRAETGDLVLPTTLEALSDTAIRARTNGYLAKWLVDIGGRVKAGQTLAIIDSPEVDEQLNQARASLEQARANLELARVTAARWEDLAGRNAVPRQEVDQRAADYAARRAQVAAAEAEVGRLVQLQAFETVAAPFDGVISARNVDIGDLVKAGGGAELFHIVASGVLRLYVNVPQSRVTDIRVGLPAEVRVAEFPGRSFAGAVARFAGALDSQSRTLTVEVDLPNPTGELIAGMYAEVHFRAASPNPPVLVPSEDAIIRAEGTFVAIVTKDNRIHIQPVVLGRDDGTEIEVLEGLKAGERVVENPSDALADGFVVEPVLKNSKNR